MAIISNGTTVASGGSLQNVPAPTNSQILTGVASAGANVVGSYAMIHNKNINTNFNPGTTQAMNGANDYEFSSANNYKVVTHPSGTWRCMGASESKATASQSADRTTIWIRIS
jgi:hypothetical protein